MTFWKKKPIIRYEVEKATAARAVFQTTKGAIPRIELNFETESGDRIQFDMDIETAGRMIEQAMSAYNAIVPPLKTSRGGLGL